MLSLLVEQQNTHVDALLGTRLTIRIEKLQRLPSASVLLDSDPDSAFGRSNFSLEVLPFMKGQRLRKTRLAFGVKPENERILLMTYRAFTHIALIVSPLRQAEEFYRTLFALEVAFREAETTDGWYTLPSDASWDDAEAAGISLGLCSLHRDAFTLALEDGVSSAGGRLSHIGVQVDAQDLSRLRTVALTLGCQVVQDGQTILVFDDPYRVRWEMTTSSYDDPRRLSTGVRMGRWLPIGQEH